MVRKFIEMPNGKVFRSHMHNNGVVPKNSTWVIENDEEEIRIPYTCAIKDANEVDAAVNKLLK